MVTIGVNHGVIVRLPIRERPRPAETGARRIDVIAARLRRGVGRLLNRGHIPGAIRPVEIQDGLTGQSLAVSMDEAFVRVSVDGRDYYFDRITGRFDGTGSAP